ncbi:MAG: thiamine pyrophosphate-dependent enzyme [Alphaproteobacteria bacterium]
MMHTADALKAIAAHRKDAIVISGRGSPHWAKISDMEKYDAALGDPAMGGHAGFAFGLALAQPDRKIILFDSEGDLLMSLGILTTIAELAPKNFYHFMLDNECYATTGGQPVPNAKNVDYAAIARGCGYPAAHAFTEIDDLTRAVPDILAKPGPVFCAMKVYPEVENTPIGQRKRWQTRTRDQILTDLRGTLGVG